MKNKTNKVILIFFILMLAMPIFSFSVSATETTITTDASVYEGIGKSIVVRSDGVLFSIVVNDTAPITTKVYRSNDNGVTWVENASYLMGGSPVYLASCIGVENDNTIHIYYMYWDGTHFDIKHNSLENDVWSGASTIFNNPHSNSQIIGFDVAFDSENMYFTYAYQQDNTGFAYICYKSFNLFLSTWGTAVTLETQPDYDPVLFKPSICIYSDDVYIFYENTDTGNNIEYAVYHNSNDTWTTEHILSDGTYPYYKPDSIVVGGKIYVFYHGNTSGVTGNCILYKSYSGTSWSGESVLHGDTGYNQTDPTVSLNTDGTINVVWSGKSSVSTAYYQLRQRSYSGTSWGNTAYISSGSTNKIYPHLCYQDYPLFTHLSSGLCITYIDNTNDDFEYIDSGSLTWYSDDDYQGDFEFDANNNIGNLDTGCTMGINFKTIEFKYQVPTTINATGFDLLVSPQMHTSSSDLSNYDLYINGYPMGNPTEWKQYSDKWVLRWIFSEEKVITNSEILFEVYHDVYLGGNYWYVGVSCGYNDLDGDGIASMRYSNTYPNGVFDGTWLAKDVAYQIYFNVISFVEDETPVEYNTISAVNTTYYVGDSVPLTYTIKASDLVYDNYVRIWNDDTAIEITAGTMQGFPYLCTHQVETIGFVPFTSANYTAKLFINSMEVDNVSFFAEDHIDSDMHVFTYPNPSKVGQKIWVKYKFDHPTNKSGAIFLSYTPDINNYISVNYLSDGDNGFWTTSFDTVGIYYYILAVDTTGNGTYGIVNNGIHAHYVRSEHGNNFFTVRWLNLKLDIDGSTIQTISGECNMISGNCYIYDNNRLVKTITESPFFYQYEVHTAGLHTVEMRLITNVTTVLCTQNYTVTTYTGDEDIDQVEDSGYVIRDYIYDNWGDFGIFIAGVLIILGFMFIPLGLVLYVNVAHNKNMDVGDMHWSMYLIFAIVGVIVVVQLHLADVWIVLLICVVSIAIAVITYCRNS